MHKDMFSKGTQGIPFPYKGTWVPLEMQKWGRDDSPQLGHHLAGCPQARCPALTLFPLPEWGRMTVPALGDGEA